jgi:hypothetical protein
MVVAKNACEISVLTQLAFVPFVEQKLPAILIHGSFQVIEPVCSSLLIGI